MPTTDQVDIVDRLRWSISADTPARYPDIVSAAADEIERLRASLKILWGILDQPPPEWQIIADARTEIRRVLDIDATV